MGKLEVQLKNKLNKYHQQYFQQQFLFIYRTHYTLWMAGSLFCTIDLLMMELWSSYNIFSFPSLIEVLKSGKHCLDLEIFIFAQTGSIFAPRLCPAQMSMEFREGRCHRKPWVFRARKTFPSSWTTLSLSIFRIWNVAYMSYWPWQCSISN